MIQENTILVGKAEGNDVVLLPSMACRHGLIAGATGTGKTVSLKVLAEGFSKLGVPVFLADIKGDVSSIALPGKETDSLRSRLDALGISDFSLEDFPVRFWDVFGQAGIPVRATVNDMGPALIGRLLSLTDAQQGVLNIVFQVSDDLGWELLDFKDLKAMIQYVNENKKELGSEYGNISTASANALLRALIELENQGAEQFFGEPDLNIMDWITTDARGRGTINLLEADQLSQNPLLYSAFLLWMLSELQEQLPEAGDLDKPKIVLFFDEAHLIFSSAPKSLLQKIEQTVKLIRSKGVGVYFITQNPSDIPDGVLAQLQNRLQHALHAYTPKEQKAVKTAAQSFRPNPAFSTTEAIGSLKIGEALVSFLDENGAPCIVQKTTILPPQSSFEALSPAAIAMVSAKDPFYKEYSQRIDNPSAYEKLQAEKNARAAEEKTKEKEKTTAAGKKTSSAKQQPTQLQKSVKKAARSASRSIGRDIGQSVVRGVMGNSKSTAGKAASRFAGNIAADLFGSFFK